MRLIMKRLDVILVFVLCFLVVSCSDKAPQSPNQGTGGGAKVEEPIAHSEEPEEEEPEDVQVAPKKGKLFYQNLLEYFCRQHYKECFGGLRSPRDFSENSVVVTDEPTVTSPNMDGDRIVSWNVHVKGVHSWQGYFDKRHPDWDYEADIKELGDDKYQITFVTPEVTTLGKPSKKKNVSATRVVEYSE